MPSESGEAGRAGAHRSAVPDTLQPLTRFTARRPHLHSIAPKPARIALPWAGGGRSNTLCYITNTPHVE